MQNSNLLHDPATNLSSSAKNGENSNSIIVYENQNIQSPMFNAANNIPRSPSIPGILKARMKNEANC